jgi:prepilin-type N-terminal cleavage/methylation domain-containing protein
LHVTRRANLHDERGFTLVELLTAISIGMIVLFATFTVLDRTISASGQIADRSEALQRGRQAMALVTRQLRSQVCVGTTTPIVSGTDTSISFYADLTDGTPTNPIKQRTLSYDSTTDTITETVTPSAGTYPTLTFTGTPTSSPLLTKVKRILESDGTTLRPIFRYYGYQTGTTNGTLVQLSAPLSATDIKRVAEIKVGFRSFALRPISNDKDSTVLEDDVYTRTAVPTELQGAPECI